MEYCTNNEHTFLEDLLALRDTPDYYYYTNQDYCYYNTASIINDSFNNINSTFLPASAAFPAGVPSPFHDCSAMLPSDHSPLSYAPFGDALSPPDFAADSSGAIPDCQTLSTYAPTGGSQEEYYYCSVPPSVRVGDGAAGLFGNGAPCKPEPGPEVPGFDFCSAAVTPPRKSKAKKVIGQPSKNLMAERRRRKRLNDRLSMLRSVVPKISKMDRTSILGDTIDYMKELLERINSLQEDMHLSSMSIFKDVKASEVVVRNSPKFDVERRNEDTRIEICSGGKPGLLLSTVTTLEALGLEIQQCVISCFNDFAMQASCSEEVSKRAVLDSEDIKQALLRNAGYGGKCL